MYKERMPVRAEGLGAMHVESDLPADARVVRACRRQWSPPEAGSDEAVSPANDLRVPDTVLPSWTNLPALAWAVSQGSVDIIRFGQPAAAAAVWPTLLGILVAARQAGILAATGPALLMLARHPSRPLRRRLHVGALLAITAFCAIFSLLAFSFSVILTEVGHSVAVATASAVLVLGVMAGAWYGLRMPWLHRGLASVDELHEAGPGQPSLTHVIPADTRSTAHLVTLMRHIVACADRQGWTLAASPAEASRSPFEEFSFTPSSELPSVLVREYRT